MSQSFYDAIIIGAGPAGLSGAIYLARAKYRVLVIEKGEIGGQITITEDVVNYPGILHTNGSALTNAMRRQGEMFGAEFTSGEVSEINLDDHPIITVRCKDGNEFSCVSLLLALGASPRKVGFEGEEDYQGRGVAYCATCDGEFFTGREVFVVGGGFAAVEEAMFLTKYATKVTILVRKDHLSCAQSIIDQLDDYPTISVKYRTEVESVGGTPVVKKVRLKNNETGVVTDYSSPDGGPIGVFVFAGYSPATELIKGLIELDESGYIVTDRSQATNIEGIYAGGDVCIKDLRQIVTAVSDGAIAATNMEKYISKERKDCCIPAAEPLSEKELKERAAEAGGDSETFGSGETSVNTDNTEKRRNRRDSGAFIDSDMRAQMIGLFDKMESNVSVQLVISPQDDSSELKEFIEELKGLHSKVVTSFCATAEENSYITIGKVGEEARIRYYSVPGGHEFTSFVIAIYNVGGPGQQIDQKLVERIVDLKPMELRVATTLSCTNCPEVVMATQKIASLNPGITAAMYNINEFPKIKDKYSIMAVPCMIVDGEATHFGKKSLVDILDILEQ